MAGDAHWRSVLQHVTREAAHADGGPVCPLDNGHFVHDLAVDVAQHQAVGLALAARDDDRRFLKSTLYRRARESTAWAPYLYSRAAIKNRGSPRAACWPLGFRTAVTSATSSRSFARKASVRELQPRSSIGFMHAGWSITPGT
jgi:hypothetical protein